MSRKSKNHVPRNYQSLAGSIHLRISLSLLTVLNSHSTNRIEYIEQSMMGLSYQFVVI